MESTTKIAATSPNAGRQTRESRQLLTFFELDWSVAGSGAGGGMGGIIIKTK
jgi:hypothetical protein